MSESHWFMERAMQYVIRFIAVAFVVLSLANLTSISSSFSNTVLGTTRQSTAEHKSVSRNEGLEPADTVRAFYGALRNRRYVEGFSLSVYEVAVTSLGRDDLRELEPDFEATFTQIPAVIDIKGEQITGDTATVFLQSPGRKELDAITLLKVDGEWKVGDLETYNEVQKQGRNFFFNVRMLVNERECYALLNSVIGSEVLYASKNNGNAASLDELIKMGALPESIREKGNNGYKPGVKVTPDGKSFIATAVPIKYGLTGRLSFYADTDGVRAEDKSGQVATASSPFYLTSSPPR